MKTPVAVLEGILRHAQGAESPRAEALRAWSEAVRAHPGDPESRWFQWLCEALASFGLRLRAADLPPQDVLTATQGGALAVVWRPDAEGTSAWLLIQEWQGGKARVLEEGEERAERWLSRRQLLRRLAPAGGKAPLRCVLLPPEQLIPHDALAHAAHPTPVQRLASLLKPESGDLGVVFVFALFVGLLTMATPIAVEALVNTVAFGRMLQPVIVLAILLFTFLGFAAALRAAQIFVVEILQRRLFVRLAGDLALRLPRVKEEALDGKHAPELVNRFLDVVTLQKVTAQMLLDGVQVALGALIGMTLLAVYHPWLLGFDIFLILLVAAGVFLLGRGAIRTSVRESKYKYQVTAWLQELARCRGTFRLSGGAAFAADQADHAVTHYLHAREDHFRVVWRQVVFALVTYALASTALLGLGGWLVIDGQLTLGQLVAAELIVAVIVGSFAKMGKHFEAFYDLAAAIDKLGVLLDLPLERQDGILAMPDSGGAAVKLTRVRYQAPWGRDRLADLSLEIHPAERVALLQEQGCAASLVADLLFGLREPTAGSLLLDDISLSDLRPDRLRSMVTLLRSPEVFEGTLAQNLGFDQPDCSAADLHAVLRRLGLHQTALALPDKLSTRLAADGRPLSPVEIRLVTLARALLRKPRLLVIDSLLDSLPDFTLANAMNAILQSLPETTIVIVTGRAEVQHYCDRIIDLDSLQGERPRFEFAPPAIVAGAAEPVSFALQDS